VRDLMAIAGQCEGEPEDGCVQSNRLIRIRSGSVTPREVRAGIPHLLVASRSDHEPLRRPPCRRCCVPFRGRSAVPASWAGRHPQRPSLTLS
jgi:hypothetical protein